MAVVDIGAYESDCHCDHLILQELETVDLEVNDLINQANKGGNMSNIKSAASGLPLKLIPS